MWSTASEIEFIKGIGTFSLHGKSVPRKDLLTRYIAGCQLREKWDKIDRVAVMDFAQKELSNIRA